MSQTMTTTRPAEAYAPPKISYEDFLVQYDGVHAEWVDGEVELMSPVSDAHQEISVFLLRLMNEFVEVSTRNSSLRTVPDEAHYDTTWT